MAAWGVVCDARRRIAAQPRRWFATEFLVVVEVRDEHAVIGRMHSPAGLLERVADNRQFAETTDRIFNADGCA